MFDGKFFFEPLPFLAVNKSQDENDLSDDGSSSHSTNGNVRVWIFMTISLSLKAQG